MQMLNHPNVVKLVDSFYTSGEKVASSVKYTNLFSLEQTKFT
jgi:hypothetical protein